MGSWMLGLAAALGLLAGCGASPSTAPSVASQIAGPVDPATAGRLSVHLVPDGLPGQVAQEAVTQIKLVLASLELRSAGTEVWRPVPLASPTPADPALPATTDGLPLALLTASSASPLVLASDAPWPPGSYDAMRFTPAAGGSFETGGATHDLETPDPFIRSMGLPEVIAVATGESTDLWITFSVASVIQPDPASEGSFQLLPGPVRGYDLAQTGTIEGTLAAPSPTAPKPLAGAIVTAQLELPEGASSAAIPFRTAVTGADGRFTLDLLPRNHTWCVVSQAALTEAGVTASYAVAVSPGITLGAPPNDKQSSDLQAAWVPEGGDLTGKVATHGDPDQVKWVQVNQEVDVGGVPCVFAVRDQPVAADGTFNFPLLPPGTYSAVLATFTQGPDTDLMFQTESSGSFDLAGGTRVALTFP